MPDSAHAPLSSSRPARPGPGQRPRPAPANQGWGPFLRKAGAWLCAVWFMVAAAGKMVMEHQVLGGAIVVFAGVLCLPPVYGVLKARLGKLLPLKVYIPIIIAVIVVGAQVADHEQQVSREAAQKLEQDQRIQAAAAARAAIEQEFSTNKEQIVGSARRALEGGHAAGALASIAKFAAIKDPDLARVRDAAKLEAAMTGPLTVKAFEGSEFFGKRKVTKGNSWALKSGGTNFSYGVPDPEGPSIVSSTGIELSSDPAAITRASIVFHGNSLNAPATYSPERQAFLRDFVASTFPEMNADEVSKAVSDQASRDYSGGSDTMPRVPVGKGQVFAGRTGESLIIGLER